MCIHTFLLLFAAMYRSSCRRRLRVSYEQPSWELIFCFVVLIQICLEHMYFNVTDEHGKQHIGASSNVGFRTRTRCCSTQHQKWDVKVVIL